MNVRRMRMRLSSLRQSTALAWGLVTASLVFLLVAVLLLVQSVSQAAQTEPVRRTAELTLGSDETLRITYVGDSLAAGLFATTEEESYRSLTTTALAGDGPVTEAGRALVGGTVEQTLEGNEQLPQDQDLYIVELGTNDLNDVNFRTFTKQYETLLERIERASPESALVCLGTWRPPSTGANYDLVIRQRCEAHGGIYRRLSDLEGEPAYKGPAGEDTFSGPSDTFHPNDAGHAAISDRILNAVEVRRGR